MMALWKFLLAHFHISSYISQALKELHIFQQRSNQTESVDNSITASVIVSAYVVKTFHNKQIRAT